MPRINYGTGANIEQGGEAEEEKDRPRRAEGKPHRILAILIRKRPESNPLNRGST